MGDSLENNNNRVPLYVLNNFLKFERKIYQVFGYPLGRPISIKLLLYAIVFGVIEIILYNLPIIGNVLGILPPVLLIMLPIGLGWLLADVGTEGRSPIHFFRSYLSYQKRQRVDNASWYRGRRISKQTDYEIVSTISFKEEKASQSKAVKETPVNKKKNKPSLMKQERSPKRNKVEKKLSKSVSNESVKPVAPVTESTSSFVQEKDSPVAEKAAVSSEIQNAFENPVEREQAPIHEPIAKVVEPMESVKEVDVTHEEIETTSKKPIVQPKTKPQPRQSIPQMQVLKIEKAKEEKTEQEMSNFRYLRMAMRYNSKNKQKKGKSKRK